MPCATMAESLLSVFNTSSLVDIVPVPGPDSGLCLAFGRLSFWLAVPGLSLSSVSGVCFVWPLAVILYFLFSSFFSSGHSGCVCPYLFYLLWRVFHVCLCVFVDSSPR